MIGKRTQSHPESLDRTLRITVSYSQCELIRPSLTAVRDFQPQGPCYLGGLSMGGLVALATAQQLSRAGEGVAYTMAGDTWFTAGCTFARSAQCWRTLDNTSSAQKPCRNY